MVDVLVCTPDRLLKMVNADIVKLDNISYICIDEADFILTRGFEDVQVLLNMIDERSRHAGNIQYTLITASITKPLWHIFRHDPRYQTIKVLESKSLHKPQANCMHRFLPTLGRPKLKILQQLLQGELRGDTASRQTLVFCNGLESCKLVAHTLKDMFRREGASESVGLLHKDLHTVDRLEELKRFLRGDSKVLICTDIAQRGLDLPNCRHVINFDFPYNSIDYLHRSGRTARFGEPGMVSSLVMKGDAFLAKAVQASMRLGRSINDLSSDRRDYLRGGTLSDLLQERKPHRVRSREEKGLPPLPPTVAYKGSLR